MSKLLNGHIRHVHLIGIGGVGVSWIAEILLSKGYIVTGSDLKSSSITEGLLKKGAKIHIGHHEDNVVGADLVVYTTAIGNDHVELLKAQALDIPTLTRAEMQGELMDSYKTSVAIAGAHGKSTTTSMLSVILANSEMDSTLLVGAYLEALGGNARIGKSDEIIVMEACEYKDSFLNFKPTHGIILNIDEDHLDYFENLDQIIGSFVKFAQSIPKKGALIINSDNYNAKKVINHVSCPVITIGITQDATYQAKNITFSDKGTPQFDVAYNDETVMTCKLAIPGQHNIYNALSAIALAHHIGIETDTIINALSTFTNAGRRFEELGTFNEARVIDDYAHHPTEIKATLSGALKLPHNRIFCVFQPHTFTRTHELMLEFSTAFTNADEIIITDIYAAREKDENLVHARDLAAKIREEGKKVTYIASFDEIEDYLKMHAGKGDLIFTMGAGDINKLGHQLTEK
jgi:UDP-N-acetylmuramate--alanine ligase